MENYIQKEQTQQPVILNNAVHEFDTLEKRIFYVVMNQIRKEMVLEQDLFEKNDLWFDVPTKLLGTQSYDRLKQAAGNIGKRQIKLFDSKQNEKFHLITPFPEIRYNKRWGHMKVRVLDSAYPYLAQIKDGYFWYRLRSALILSRVFSQRFYEWFCQYINTGKWINVTVDYLRTRLDIPDHEYKRNNDFVRRVVYDSITEINNKTDIFVEIARVHKKSRKIVGFDFSVKTKRAKEELEKLKEIDEYYEYLNKLSSKELIGLLMQIRDEYNISSLWFEKVLSYKYLANEVIKVHTLISVDKLKIKTNKQQYMNGVIKKKLEEMKDL